MPCIAATQEWACPGYAGLSGPGAGNHTGSVVQPPLGPDGRRTSVGSSHGTPALQLPPLTDLYQLPEEVSTLPSCGSGCYYDSCRCKAQNFQHLAFERRASVGWAWYGVSYLNENCTHKHQV